jgi:hypothetical protein
MARLRSTARVEREGDKVEGAETVPISEAMQRSGLVTSKESLLPKQNRLLPKQNKLLPKQNEEILRKLILTMITISQYRARLAIWTSGSRLSPRLISPKW